MTSVPSLVFMITFSTLWLFCRLHYQFHREEDGEFCILFIVAHNLYYAEPLVFSPQWFTPTKSTARHLLLSPAPFSGTAGSYPMPSSSLHLSYDLRPFQLLPQICKLTSIIAQQTTFSCQEALFPILLFSPRYHS